MEAALDQFYTRKREVLPGSERKTSRVKRSNYAVKTSMSYWSELDAKSPNLDIDMFLKGQKLTSNKLREPPLRRERVMWG